MTDRQFYDWQTRGGANEVLKLVNLFEHEAVSWCMIGGLAVNHWVAEPMVTQDVDIVVALDRLDDAVAALEKAGYVVKRFPYSLNVTGTSNVTIQISTDAVYRDFPGRAVPADIHGILMRVASLEDTLKGKIMAWSDRESRPSKRQKDLADILRLMESHPELEKQVPPEILKRLRD